MIGPKEKDKNGTNVQCSHSLPHGSSMESSYSAGYALPPDGLGSPCTVQCFRSRFHRPGPHLFCPWKNRRSKIGVQTFILMGRIDLKVAELLWDQEWDFIAAAPSSPPSLSFHSNHHSKALAPHDIFLRSVLLLQTRVSLFTSRTPLKNV